MRLPVLVTVALLGAGGERQEDASHAPAGPFVVVLGIAQDGGAPQAGCRRACCAERWHDPAQRRRVACLAIVDPLSHQRWMVDATPDFASQLRTLDAIEPPDRAPGLDGILLTHGHIGHYTGLIHLGREAMGAKALAVYVMPRMREFLAGNGPWDQLVRLGNIELEPMSADVAVTLNARITISPLVVPHRDEYTETVGFRIAGPNRSVLYVPDIDKWERWERSIETILSGVDAAYLDGTFFDSDEVPNRNMAEIPHPLITETMHRLRSLPAAERAKVRFIHLNHTNPALQAGSAQRRMIEAAGFRVAAERERVGL
ncbi:MAG: MBL fold metallo-hydrolase [Planctomycetota bacterium]|jgi:pyrroloquinoline quinone biosynthesis protein B